MPVAMFLCVAGLVLLWFTKRKKAGRVLTTAGFALVFVFSLGPVAESLVMVKERAYPAYERQKGFDPEYVVVLGGGNTADPALPPTSQLGRNSVVRLVEGIRVYRMHPGSRLILSGGAVTDQVTNAAAMATVALALGVPERDMILEERPWDTKDEARYIRETVNGSPFVLVTSASHMPRAMALFRGQALDPVPAPTQHLATGMDWFPAGSDELLPDSEYMNMTERFVYETLGLWWAGIRGQT